MVAVLRVMEEVHNWVGECGNGLSTNIGTNGEEEKGWDQVIRFRQKVEELRD